MIIDKEKPDSISKALMNRFVSIYVDNDIDINNNINIIIEKTGKKFDMEIKEIYKVLENTKSKQDNFEKESESFSDYESSEEASDNTEKEKEIKENVLKEEEVEKIEIPEWYNIKHISDETLREIQNYFQKKQIEINNFNEFIKIIKKLFLVYERIKKFGFTVNDCYDFINLKFNEKKEAYKKLQENILSDSKEKKNKYFFDDFNSDSWKMIMSIISSNISNTSIFLQGIPGSGKSCAARHYGAYRKFQSRNPILSVNCHRDLKFDYLVGNYNFKNSKFNFIDGPLLTAIKNGECILLDEFDLCPENVLINLLPIFKANINDEIYLKGVTDPIRITPGFLIIATGNSSKEKGRNKISSMITDEILTLEIKGINLKKNTTLIKNILDNEYHEIYQEDDSFKPDKISAEQIKQIDEVLKDINQFKLSLRQIKCLFERICRFCIDENYDIGGFKKIPVIYVIISYIIPQLKIGKEKLKELLENLDKIMKYNNFKELMEFIGSKIEFIPTYIKINDKQEQKTFIKKGNIYLLTNMNQNSFPQVVLQTFFWIRMSCSLTNENPSTENLLLAGTTCYKEYLLNEWLSIKIQKEKSIDTFYLTKNTETENLIGTSSLDDKEKLGIQIKFLIDNAILYFHLDISRINEEEYDKKLEVIKKNRNSNECLNYIYECISKLKKLQKSFDINDYQIGLKTVTSFNLGIVPKDFIFGKKLILKGIENPEPSVIERLNPILENPRHLIMIEDNQEIYNDDKIFKKIYNKKNRKSVPMNDSFRIFFTSREGFQVRLSEAFISRLTIINCPNYDNENYLTMELNPEVNYKNICESIIEENNLVKEIINFNKILSKIEKIEFLRFIRWCISTKNIYKRLENIKYNTLLHKNDSLNYKFIVGISALRSIIDRFEYRDRENILKENFRDYLPDKLYNLLTTDLINKTEECPLELIEINEKKYISSKYSGIILEFPDNETPNQDSLKNIEWTKSSVDIADAIMASLISNTILILEGPPGRGKTAISKAIYNYLNINDDNLKRINFSPSTLFEDVFARTIPKIEGEKMSTERREQGLLSILKKSENSKNFYKQGLILDEINLASDKLLEYLYFYLNALFKKEDYISPDGIKYNNIGNIGVIATMNDAKLSNSRTSLSISFMNRCHLFKLVDYSKNEKVLLAQNILTNLQDKEVFKRVMKCFEISQTISNKYSSNGGNTFREILKLKQFIDKCKDIPIDYLLELILSSNIPSSELENFRIKTGLNSISNSLNDLKLKIEKEHLCFHNFVKYKLLNPKIFEVKTHFTVSQKETLMKMMIGLLAERPILLTGDIGTGKTFVVEELANLIGANLKIIQFNSETTSLDIIGRLELTIDKNKIKALKQSIQYFTEQLIKIKYKKITKLIIASELFDISKIQNFLEEEKNGFLENPNYSSSMYHYYLQIRQQLEDLSGIKKTHFNFNTSVLIKAMKKGDWILLDDINFAPQEIEGLMPLLEEDPTLTIYEHHPVLFYTKDKTKIKDKEKDFEIHPNFRLIMTTSKDTNISSAIKSRCLCIQIKPFKEPKDYGELIVNNLKYCDIADKNIIDIAKRIGYGFYKLKEEEEQSNYILKNYILSSVNLVNLSKMLIYVQPIDDKKLAQIIEFCIFSAFKKSDKKNEIIELFKTYIKKENNIKITPIRNIKISHEHYLKKCELFILSYYYNKNSDVENILTKMNDKIHNMFTNEKTELKESMINKNIKEEEIIKEIPRKKLLENLESFTLQELKEYINDIDEVIIIFKEFLEEKDKLYQYLYFLVYLKKILMKLNLINEERLYGIKINKMEVNKEFFHKYKIEENQSIIYEKDLIWFKNMIYYFNEIIPERIPILDLEGIIFSLYYKYFKQFYQGKFEKQKFKKFYPFLILSNNILREKAKKYDFYNTNCWEKELYNVLKYYDDIIDFDIDKEQIYIKKYDFNVSLNEKKKIKFEEIKEKLEINSSETSSKIIDKKKYIKYYYPIQYYKEENLLKIFFFFNLFIIDYIDDNELKKILPDELYYFNEMMNSFLKENKNYIDQDKKLFWGNTYNFINIIKTGYKLLDSIKKIKKEKIIFSHGIDLLKSLEVNEDNVNIIIDKIDIIKKYVNNEMLWPSINDKYKILEEKKKEFIIKNEKDELITNINLLKSKFKTVLEDENYKFLKKDIKQIKNQLELKKLENDLLIIEESLKRKETEENKMYVDQKQKKTSKHINILYTYSQLFSIIEEFKNINLAPVFINRVVKFQKLIKEEEPKIDILSAYKEQIFSSCEQNSPVSKKMINIFEHLANSYLISEVVKNNLENNFNQYLVDMMDIKENIIKDIDSIFTDNEYIYFPELSNEDIGYCFKYGDDNYESGELNPSKINQIFIENNLPRKAYLDLLKKKLTENNNNNFIKEINSNLEKIDKFYSNYKTLNFNIDISWLTKTINELKNEALKFPNRIIIKNKYKDSLNFNDKIFKRKKILVKSFFILFEGNKKISIKGNDNSLTEILNKIINDIQNSNKNFPFSYRIMDFYDFHLYEDFPSKTMVRIIETINYILIKEFRCLLENDILIIIKEIYAELINLVLSQESPKFEDSKAVDIFKIIYQSFLKKYQSEFEKMNDNFRLKIKKFLDVVFEIKNKVNKNIDSEFSEYKRKYKLYQDDIKKLDEKVKEKANKYYQEHNWKNFGNYYIMNKKDVIKNYKETNEYKKWVGEQNLSCEPFNDPSWKKIKKQIEESINQLKKIEFGEKKDVQNIIDNYKINKNKYIDRNDYDKYLNLINEIKSDIEKFNNMPKADDFLNCKINKYYYKIEQNKIDLIYRIISRLENNLSFFSLFKIKKYNIKKNNNNNSIYSNIYIKPNSNIIFKKGNSKPAFLNKNMKIDLGLYIYTLDNDLKNIGTLRIKNNYPKKLKYAIKQDPNNEIISYSNSDKELFPNNKELIITFKFNVINKKAGFYSSKFEIILIEDNDEIDKCIVYAYINVIPFIIKFSIPNEKYSIYDNNIQISHYVKELNIFHSFPGNYCSDKLGINLLNNNYKDKVTHRQNNDKNKGQIFINSEFSKEMKKIDFKLCLSLHSLELFYLKIFHQNPLRIFDEKTIDLEKIIIMKNMKKNIFLFNMSNNIINLKFEYNNSFLEVKVPKQEIGSKEVLKIEINNKILTKETNLKINGKLIAIKGLDYPIKLTGSNLNCDFKEMDDKILAKFTLYLIDQNFHLNKINNIHKYYCNYNNYNIFSAYLIFNNEIIVKCNGIYNYEPISLHRIKEIYGFSKDEFGIFKYNDENLKIALSYKNDYYRHKILFDDSLRDNLKNAIIKFIDKAKNNNINDINTGLSELIKTKIKLCEIKTIKNLKLFNNKLCGENIIIFLLKYPLTEKLDDFRGYLQNIINTIYKNPGRIINKLYEFKIQDKNVQLILDKLSYILSFLLLILYPGDILDYEYKDNTENKNIDINYGINFDKNPIYIKLIKEADEYNKQYREDSILNKDIIYYKGKISIHDENDEFSKFEKQIRENDINVDIKKEEESEELVNLCYDEINRITDDISNNNINISNLLLFLDGTKNILLKIPYILSKKEEQKIKSCINGVLYIHDYLHELSKDSIKDSKFFPEISKYKEEFDYLISMFEKINNNEKHIFNNIKFDSLTKCQLPSEEKNENDILKDKKIGKKKNNFPENNFLTETAEIKQYNSEILNNEIYENIKDLNIKKKG